MVILGAGASHDSVNEDIAPKGGCLPPLAPSLFSAAFGDHASHFSESLPVIEELRREIGRGRYVEEELERIEGEANAGFRSPRQMVAIRFYLQSVLWDCPNSHVANASGVTNYVGLVHHLDRWRRAKRQPPVCYVTFNYDTMLERASTGIGFRSGSMDSYVDPDGGIKILKLHGSVDWGHPAAMTANHGSPYGAQLELIQRAGEYGVSEGFQWMATPDHLRVGNQTALFPAIALPVVNKRVFECPPQHLKVVQDALPEVTRLLVIGWRATEQHFLDLITQHQPGHVNTLIVSESRNSAQRTLDNLAPKLGIGGCSFVESGFSGLLGASQLEALLA